MTNKDSQSREWIKELPRVIKALNNEETRLIGLKLKDAIEMRLVEQSTASPARRPVGKKEKKIVGNTEVRYLYAPGEAANNTCRRATDPL